MNARKFNKVTGNIDIKHKMIDFVILFKVLDDQYFYFRNN
jgi:hypothetical protein